MKKIFLFVIFCFFIFRVKASEIDLAKHAKSAILVENNTGEVLYKKNENEKRSPASMTKIMTLLLLMERIDNGIINLNDKVIVSKNASDMGGTQIFLEQGSTVDILTLIKGITIASANDVVVIKKQSQVIGVEITI